MKGIPVSNSTWTQHFSFGSCTSHGTSPGRYCTFECSINVFLSVVTFCQRKFLLPSQLLQHLCITAVSCVKHFHLHLIAILRVYSINTEIIAVCVFDVSAVSPWSRVIFRRTTNSSKNLPKRFKIQQIGETHVPFLSRFVLLCRRHPRTGEVREGWLCLTLMQWNINKSLRQQHSIIKFCSLVDSLDLPSAIQALVVHSVC